MESKNNRQRILSAGLWILGGNGMSQIIRLLGNLIMTRMLAPELFGMMAITSVIMIGLSMFSDFGLKQNIVQSRRGEDPAFLNTVWMVQIMRGVLLWVVAALLCLFLYILGRSGFIAPGTVYSDTRLPIVLTVVSLSTIINGFESTKTAVSLRRLSRRILVFKDLAGQVAGLAAMIIWALFDRSIWALVAGGLVSSIVSVVISHVLLPGECNRWQWDRSSFDEIFHFGKWVFLSSILGFLVNNGDRLLLGGILAPRELGVYVIAFFLVNSMVVLINRLLAGVAFPVMSETVRLSPEKLKKVYYRFKLPLDFFLFFMVGLLFESGRYLVLMLYDDRYSQAGAMLEILSVSLIAIRYNLVDQCYLALGKVKILAGLSFIKAITLFLLVPLMYRYFGMTGALWGIVISYYAGIPYTFYFKYKYNFLNIGMEVIPLPLFFIGMLVGYAGKFFLIQ